MKLQKTFRKHKGGASHCGPNSDPSDDSILTRIAVTWDKLGKDVWWSEGQSGYYFSNRTSESGERCKTCYQSQTHTHVYDIQENAEEYLVKFATKKYNKHVGHGEVIVNNVNNVLEFITNKNIEIGAVSGCASNGYTPKKYTSKGLGKTVKMKKTNKRKYRKP